MTNQVPNVLLNNGIEIPQLGYGVYKIPPAETKATVLTALDLGYRHVDTATLYRNEAEVGEAVRESGLLRDEVFVTTKLWNDDHGYDEAMRAFDASMGRLGLEVLDLYLIHWPMPAQDRYVETWRALERLYLDGRVRAVGVSNFKSHHLRRLVDETEIVPVLNQVELHPYLQQADLRRTHAELGVVTEAWAPLARGGALLADPVVGKVADKHGRTPAQVVLRWHVERGHVVIPKSVTPARIEENAALFDFALEEEDLVVIDGLDRDGRTGSDPDEVG